MAGMYVKEVQFEVKFIEKQCSRGRSRGTRYKTIRIEYHKLVYRQRRQDEIGEYPEGINNDQEKEKHSCCICV